MGYRKEGKGRKDYTATQSFFPFYNRHYIFMVVIVIIIIKCSHLKCKMESFIKQNIKIRFNNSYNFILGFQFII